MAIPTLETVMRLDSTAFRAGMTQAATSANRSLKSIQTSAQQTTSVLLGLKRAANALGSLYLVKQAVGALVESQVRLQQIQFTLLAATGSAREAGDAFDYVRQESEKLGLSILPAATGFARLSASAVAAGVGMSQQKELFDAYAKASTTLHLSTEESNRALLALEQMFAKGKIQAQELRLQLGQAIPGAALRFQNAVMEVTKGTDLAGKSFDQLLREGALTTSRFLPQLVQALQQSGRGVEEASKGLNAQLNRVRTAWFDLKSDLSSGLFNDVTTEGAKLLAEHMESLANALTLVAAGAGARGLASILKTIQGRLVTVAQHASAPALAAASEKKYATSVAESAAAESAAARSAAKLAALRAGSTAAEVARQRDLAMTAAALRDEALAEQQAAAAAAEGAGARAAAARASVEELGANTRGIVSLEALGAAYAERTAAEDAAVVANIRLEESNIKLAESEAAVRVATSAQGVAFDANLKAKEAQVAANTRLAASNRAVAGAAEGVAAANVMEREAAAANTLAARAGAAAKSIGGMALSLVGGWWGVGALAIGGLALAIYKAHQNAVQYTKDTKAQIGALKDETDQVKAAAAAYGTLGNQRKIADDIKATSDASDKLTKSLADAQREVDNLQQQYDDAQRVQKAFRGSTVGVGDATADVAGKLKAAQDRLRKLQEQARATQPSIDDLSSSIGVTFKESVDKGSRALDDLLNHDFTGFIKGVRDAAASVPRIAAEVDAGRKEASSGLDAIQQAAESAHKRVLKVGTGFAGQIKSALAETVEGIKQQHLSAEEEARAIKAAQDAAAKGMPDALKADALNNAKAIDKQTNAYNGLVAQIRSRIAADQEQLTGGQRMTAAERLATQVAKKYQSGTLKLTAAQWDNIQALLTQAKASGEAARAQQQKMALDTREANLQRQLADAARAQTQANQDKLKGVGHGDQWTEEARALTAITRQYDAYKRAADKAYAADQRNGVDAATAAKAHKESIKQINDAETEALNNQEKLYADLRNARSDMTNGIHAAMEQYVDEGQNAAALAKGAFGSAFSDMTDSLGNFVATGKGGFKDLVNSIIADMARMEVKVLASSILSSIFGNAVPVNAAQAQTFTASDITWGGGHAAGGPVGRHTLTEVAENGRPEMLSANGRSYLMTGDAGAQVYPAQRAGPSAASAGGYGGSQKVEINITHRGGDAVKATQATATKKGNDMIVNLILDTVKNDVARSGGTFQTIRRQLQATGSGIPVGG